MILHLFDMHERRLLDVDTIESCIHTENADGNVLDVVGYGIPKEAKYVAFKDVDGVFQLFEVRTYTKDPITAEVTLYAENAMYELNTETPITDKRPTNVQAGLAVTQALAGTRWTLGGTIQTGVASTRWFYISPLQALNDVVQVWGIRLRPRVEFSGAAITGRYIDVVSAAPVWRGKRFEIGKDILSAKFTIDDRNVVTAIVPRGKGQESGDGFAQRIGIDSVTWSKAAGNPIDKPLGQNYIEIKEATALYGVCGQRPRFATVVYADIDNAEELCNAAYKSLQEVSAPTLCGDMTTIDLERIGFPHEGARYNDGVAFICEDMRFISTIVGTARQYAGRATADFSFGALYPTPAKQMLDIRRELGSVSNIAAVGAGIAQANPDLLKGIIDTSVTRIMSGKTNRDTMPDGSEIYTSADGTKAVRLAGGGILLASSKTAGEWNWRTAIDGGGIVADFITSGILQASLIRILGTDRFYWDSGNIVAQNPENTNQQIRFGCYDGIHYGIAMTQDGGQTWQNCISFNGVTIGAGSITQSMLDPAIDLGGSTIYYAESTPGEAKAGDVWYDTANHLIKRWSGTSWIDITNEALSAALVAAGDAQATADGKVRTFAQATAPTGMTAKDVGDLWIDTNDNNKLYRWNGSSWATAQDTHLDNTVKTLATDLLGLSNEISTKTTVFYTASTPAAPAVGDVWYDTANHLIKRWGGSSWADITNEALSAALVAAGDAQATADGKIRTFAQDSAPTGMTAKDVGDLWIDTNDNNKLHRWSGTTWVAVRDVYLDERVTKVEAKVTDTAIINTVTSSESYKATESSIAAAAAAAAAAQNSANDAASKAGAAQQTASNAATAASNAQDSADGADEKARIAQQAAADAAAAASNAQSTANNASSAAAAAQNTANSTANSLTSIDKRVTSAEAKITADAIVQTVTSSTTYTNAMNGKQDTATLISSINQSAEAIKIKANKIALEGTVTANNYFKINTDGSMEATNASISGVLYSGGWVFYSEGAAYNDDYGGQIQMISYNGRAYFRAINLDAVFGSTSYGNVSVYGGNITLDCASTGQSVSVRNGTWEPGYSYSDVCLVCDQAGSSYSTAAGNLGTTGHRWDVFWCDTVHYNTRDTSSSREVKHDIKPLADFGEAIDKLTPVSFVYNDDRRQRIRYGLIWEDTIDIMPDICHITEEDGQKFKGISYDDVITVLLKEVQSLRQRVARLEKQNS